MIVKNINGWWNGTVKKPTDDRTMPDIPQHNKCIFCDGQEGNYIGVTKVMRMKLKDNLLVPADDRDLRMIVGFRNAVKAGDRRRLEDKRVAQRIADCYTRYMTMRATASYLEMDLAEVKFITEHDANLRDLYHKHQHDWGRIIVYDDHTNSYTTYPNKYEAAVKIGFQRLSDLNYYLKYRHYPYLIKGRFKVKRRVWFDEDGCM